MSKNYKWRIHQKFKNGEMVGLNSMYGYVIKNKTIITQKEQANVVKQIFKWYLDGESATAIANKLNYITIRPMKFELWNSNKIFSILKNDKYTGNALLQKPYNKSKGKEQG